MCGGRKQWHRTRWTCSTGTLSTTSLSLTSHMSFQTCLAWWVQLSAVSLQLFYVYVAGVEVTDKWLSSECGNVSERQTRPQHRRWTKQPVLLRRVHTDGHAYNSGHVSWFCDVFVGLSSLFLMVNYKQEQCCDAVSWVWRTLFEWLLRVPFSAVTLLARWQCCHLAGNIKPAPVVSKVSVV